MNLESYLRGWVRYFVVRLVNDCGYDATALYNLCDEAIDEARDQR